MEENECDNEYTDALDVKYWWLFYFECEGRPTHTSLMRFTKTEASAHCQWRNDIVPGSINAYVAIGHLTRTQQKQIRQLLQQATKEQQLELLDISLRKLHLQ